MREKGYGNVVTIYDIAKRANVSPMTVSRYINQSGYMSEETKRKVEKAIDELGYVPNLNARSLISKKTKILSLLITDITNPFFTKVARGAEDKAKQLGYQILLSNTDENMSKESDYIETVLATRVDGVLLAPAGDESVKNLKRLRKHHIPFVLIDREIQGIDCDLILGDSYEGARKLTEHLLQQGHRKIAMLNGPAHISTARERKRGYEETLKLADIRIDQRWISEINFKKDDAHAAIEQFLSLDRKDRPTAIFAANNFIAVSAIHALRNHGVKVPDEMTIVCFDDIDPYTNTSPYLTAASASQPAYDYGYMGIQFLIERIEGKAPASYRRIELSPEMHFATTESILK
mgnify:CR=1 FL=1